MSPSGKCGWKQKYPYPITFHFLHINTSNPTGFIHRYTHISINTFAVSLGYVGFQLHQNSCEHMKFMKKRRINQPTTYWYSLAINISTLQFIQYIRQSVTSTWSDSFFKKNERKKPSHFFDICKEMHGKGTNFLYPIHPCSFFYFPCLISLWQFILSHMQHIIMKEHNEWGENHITMWLHQIAPIISDKDEMKKRKESWNFTHCRSSWIKWLFTCTYICIHLSCWCKDLWFIIEYMKWRWPNQGQNIIFLFSVVPFISLNKRNQWILERMFVIHHHYYITTYIE
jgi:hypothetical protein